MVYYAKYMSNCLIMEPSVDNSKPANLIFISSFKYNFGWQTERHSNDMSVHDSEQSILKKRQDEITSIKAQMFTE